MFEIRQLFVDKDKDVLRKQTDLASAIEFFFADITAHRSYIAAFDGDKVVGLAGFREKSWRVPDAIGVSFISTHRGHQNQGITSQLVSNLFAYARASNKSLAMSAYEPQGLKYLRPVIQRTAQ